MKLLPTTSTAVEKLKKRARALRPNYSSLGASRDAAAVEAGYDSFHHVTHCLKASSAPTLVRTATAKLPLAVHPQVLAAAEPGSHLVPAHPTDKAVFDLLASRSAPLASVELLEIKPRDASRVFCRLQIGSRAWTLHLDQWQHLRIGMEAKPRSRAWEDQSGSAPYANVIHVRWLDQPPAGMAITKYSHEKIFSLRHLSLPEIAEVAYQFGLFVGARGHFRALEALKASPAFQILATTMGERSRKPKPHTHADYWDWRDAAGLGTWHPPTD